MGETVSGRVVLIRERRKRLEEGHPWVFRTEIERIEGEPDDGALVEVVDHRGRFLGIGYLNRQSMISVRVLSRRRQAIDRAFWERRLEDALDLRRRFLPEETSFRLLHAEADGFPGLIVDKYEEYLVVESLTLGMETRLGEIVPVLAERVQPRGILLRGDVPVREKEGLPRENRLLWGEEPPGVIPCREAGLVYRVDVHHGQKTGHFFDQRENRLALRPLVAGARVLDAFCHTGGFALNAARFGAREVIGIDSAEAALRSAQENAAANGLEGVCRFEEDNVFDRLRAYQGSERFDVIILDPPAFAKNRKALEGALRGYHEINLRALRLVQPGGFLITASCSQAVDRDLFEQMLTGAARDAGRSVQVLERRGAGGDHPVRLGAPETDYLKCWICRVF